MTRIKICGLRRPQDIRYVNEAEPDMAGFILSPGYRRSIGWEHARQLRELLKPQIRAAGVFVDEPREQVAEAARRIGLEIIQLHGREDRDYIRWLQRETGLPVIKAMDACEYDPECPAEMVLLDSGKGSGRTFDWEQVPPIRHRKWFLAGGIGYRNAAEAIEKLHPWGIDLSSSVETDGAKDRGKIIAITARIRRI